MIRPRDIRRRAREVLGIGARNLSYIYPWNPRRNFPLVDDKLRTKEVLAGAGIPVPATLEVVRGFFQVPRVARELSRRADFVIKPARGRAGGGVLVVHGGSEPPAGRGERIDEDALRRHLADILFGVHSFGGWDVAMVEERLRPHPFLAPLWPEDILDVRVILFRTRPVLAMLRVPTAGSAGRTNLHAGALGVAIDLERGTTRGGVRNGIPVERHPDTGAVLDGIRIPDWDRVLVVAAATARALPLGYIGVDVCLDGSRGPVILEANARPGLEIQNVNRTGLRPLLEAVEA